MRIVQTKDLSVKPSAKRMIEASFRSSLSAKVSAERGFETFLKIIPRTL